MRGLDPTGEIATSAAGGEASNDPGALGMTKWEVQGSHDELKPLLVKLGLKKYCRAFTKYGIESIALLRSMAALQHLRGTLKEIGMVDENEVSLLQSAVLSHSASGGLAGGSDHTASNNASSSEDEESEEDEETKARKRETPHLAVVTKKEYEEILDWSDDEDMTTPQGRFNRRKKKEGDYQTSHTMQYMMREGEEGALTDVSKGPRNILKRLLRASPPEGFQNPVDGFEVEVAYVGRIRPTVDGPCGPTMGPLTVTPHGGPLVPMVGPVGEIFDERTEADPLHATIGAGDFYLRPFEQAVETMRQGEKALITINPRVAYGGAGCPATGNRKAIPPYAYLEYEVHLLKVYEVCYLAMGAVVKKTLRMPEFTTIPDATSEVTVRWSGKIMPSGKVFKPSCTQTFSLTDTNLPKWWKTILMGNENNAAGGRGMGEGEQAVFTIPPSLGFGSEGKPLWSVPPGATLQIKVELKKFVFIEDISPNKDGTAIKRLEVRGQGEDTPKKGDECACSFKVRNGRTGEVYHDKPDHIIVLGDMPERQRTAMRLLSDGAYVDRVVELMLSQMRAGETSEVRCKQSFIGCHSGDDVVIRMSLHAHVKLFTCPDCNGEVEVRVERDPSDQRGPNEESTCGVRYTVRAFKDETMRGGRKPVSEMGQGFSGWHGPRLGGLLGAQGEVIETQGSPGEARDTDDHSGLFKFVQGTKAEGVLPCIDKAVQQMRKGGKAWVSSTARFAYGSDAFVPTEAQAGLVEQWKDFSVEVELELVDVNRFKANYAMEVDEKVVTQQKRRAQGNELFKLGEYEKAMDRYEEAIEYAAMACEVCQTEMPYREQHAVRKTIDDGKAATHVNMATCHLKMHAAGAQPSDATSEELKKKFEKDPSATHLTLAIDQCDKALKTDKGNMKALYRRGQAWMRMGDLPKAKDDLLRAAKKDPNSREIRAELETLKQLEKEEAEGAKELWKSDFITKAMSFRAQQGASSVSEAIAKQAAKKAIKKGGSKAAKEAAKEEKKKAKAATKEAAKAATTEATKAEAEADGDDDDEPRIVEVGDDDAVDAAAADESSDDDVVIEEEKAAESESESSDDDVVIEEDESDDGDDVVIEECPVPESEIKSTGVGKLAKGFLSNPKKKAVEEEEEDSDSDDDGVEVEEIGGGSSGKPAVPLKKGFLKGGKRVQSAAEVEAEAEEAYLGGRARWEARAHEKAKAEAEGGGGGGKVGKGTPLGAGFLEMLRDPKEMAEAKAKAAEHKEGGALAKAEAEGVHEGVPNGDDEAMRAPPQPEKEDDEEDLMPWDPEPEPEPAPKKAGATKTKKKKKKAEGAEGAEGAGGEATGAAALAKEHREWVEGGKAEEGGSDDDGGDEDEEEEAAPKPEPVEGSEGAAGVRRRARKHFKFNAAPKLVLPNGRDILGNGAVMKRILSAGNSLVGKPPKDALVKVHYTGWLMDGTRFDSSRDRFGHPFFKLGAGFERRCLEEGVATMNRGELAEFVCTAAYAYGSEGWKEGDARGSGEYKVPPRSTVRWEVELYSWSGFTGDHSQMGDAEMMDQAYHLKAKGTEYFKMGQFDAASERYHEAGQLIDNPKFNLKEELPEGWLKEAQKLLLQCQLNEAQCELKLENWNKTITLCEKVLERPSLLSTNQRVKAHYRRHQARFAKQEYEEALEDLQVCKELDPKNDDVHNSLMGVKWAKRLSDRAQAAQFGGMFNKKGDGADGGPGGKSTELYKEERGIPPWVGELPTVWLDLAVDGRVLGRVVIELFAPAAPKTCENFRSLCTGERGNGQLSKAPLHYRGVRFHRIIRNFLIQGGDIVSGDGMGGESVFGGQFGDENLEGKHDGPGIVSMANAGKDMNGSQFFITTTSAPHLDHHSVVVGRVVVGMEVVRMVERVAVDANDCPIGEVMVDDCGGHATEIPHLPLPKSEWPQVKAEREAERAEFDKRMELSRKRDEERRKREEEEAEMTDSDIEDFLPEKSPFSKTGDAKKGGGKQAQAAASDSESESESEEAKAERLAEREERNARYFEEMRERYGDDAADEPPAEATADARTQQATRGEQPPDDAEDSDDEGVVIEDVVEDTSKRLDKLPFA